MKIYLAAMYGQMMEMRDVRDRLVAAGYEVTSQWIDNKEGDSVDGAAEKVRLRAGAEMDVADVLRADVLVAFSLERGTMHTGGGRHVEFGVALQADMPIVVVGPKGEHIFHYWPGVRHVADVDALVDFLELQEIGG